MHGAIQALARSHRVFTFSLSDVDGPNPFDGWVAHIDRQLATANLRQAAIVGVSFGGLVALRYAARSPQTASSLILVSTPAPAMRLTAEQARYVAYPRLTLPLFALRGAQRLAPELLAVPGSWSGRATAAITHGLQVVTAPANPRRMAGWVEAWRHADLTADCARVTAPTLVLTGEPGLDRVVPVQSSLEYLELIPGARHVTLPRTGHMGLILRPDAFASAVSRFVTARTT